MKKLLFSIFVLVGFSHTLFAQRVENFKLQDIITGKEFELNSKSNQKAVIIIFSSLNCPFSRLYEERIVDLHKTYSDQGYTFVMVNPHFNMEEGESKDDHIARSKSRGIIFPILDDSQQVVARLFQASKLPEVVVITPSQTGFSVVYKGAIDNNPQVAANANIKYLDSALQAIQNRRNPSPSSSRPVGCNIRLTKNN
ncbi:redoxin domain-containing protein [Mongoliibacter ruber]|uniref:AhpC/TSA family protein n=1 Tax=Mongoliibacter ruber TaxID=1750599 RepID=A0A2T0WN40_9BACT|nr:redoxin domain-containing protein [Mongoliibacter ruber]PRY88092.1 AhpC/TSA family protein [Mongoliibacter ruber]